MEETKEKKKVYTGFLQNKKVLVQFIPKPTKEIRDPNHVAYGGRLENTYIHIAPPRLRKDKMKNILTDEEKAGLEHLMGRDLSIYGEFWKGYRKGGIFPIPLGKEDLELDLSVPEDYIKWKVLLNSNLVANSKEDYKNKYREEYQFVIVDENESTAMGEESTNDKAKAFAFYTEYTNSSSVLRYVLRKLGKNTHARQEIGFLREQIGLAIDNPKDLGTILKVAKDDYLKEKVLLEEAVILGVLDRISGQYFTKEKEPISGEGDIPDEDNAAKFLGSPIGQELRLAIEARVKNARE